MGAGDGTLLDSLTKVGRPVTGLERNSMRPDMLDAELAAIEGKWSAVVFWHSLEHLRDARDAIRQASRLLVDEGLVVIAVPNSSSVQAETFGDRWLALDIPRHLVHLTADALMEALRQDGLSVTRASHYRGGQVAFGWLHGLVGALPVTGDLYDAIRRSEARARTISPARRLLTLGAAVLLTPLAILLTIAEVACRRGGTFYVEARLAPTKPTGITLTGERVSTARGAFNPTWQRHVASYREASLIIGDGPILDLGCGVGHSFEMFGERSSVGVDISKAALNGQPRRTVCADMRAIPFKAGSFSSVVCVHAIEHVPDPDLVVAEAARVIKPDGISIFVTPNRLTFARADEIIDPYHWVEFSSDELRALCEKSFKDVEILGLQGSQRQLEFVSGELKRLDRLLSLDPLRLRRFVPNRVKRFLYDLLLKVTRWKENELALAITDADFHVVDCDDVDKSLDLIAICRRPRNQSSLDQSVIGQAAA